MSFFLPYQAAWIRDNSRIKIMEKSRQIGMSWAAAYRAVSTTACQGARFDTWISSRDETQAKLFGEDCARFARVLNQAARDMAVEVVDRKEKVTAHVLPLANGRAICSMSSNPNAQAGKRGARVLDEFALHPDPRQLYAIAYPGIMWGGTLEILSTHRGSANFFNQLVHEAKHLGNPKQVSLHTVSIETAVAQGLLSRLKKKWPQDDPRQQLDDDGFLQSLRNQCPDEETWQQEFLCQPADDQGAFLSYDLIAGCETPEGEAWRTDLRAAAGPLYVGVDLGREHDLTVLWVVEDLAPLRVTRRIEVLDRQTFAAQEAALDALLSNPKVRRCCIDQTGLGRQFAERAAARYGAHRVEGVSFTAGTKEEMAYPVRAAFEQKTLRIPADKAVRADLRAIRRETGAGGRSRFAADRGPGGHADRFWALALALHAARPVQTTAYTGALL
ncbi:MAG: terminase family protein [Verrucomicrobium sp.]|nr:terminase family protein [Verrucomicrobium sp.]